MIKKIGNGLSSIVDITLSGFYYICLVLAHGFFFYFYIVGLLFSKIFKLKIFSDATDYFKKKQKDPVAFLSLVLLFFLGVFLYTYFYVDNNEVKYVDKKIIENEEVSKVDVEDTNVSLDDDKELNLYRKYAKYDINNVNINDLKGEINSLVSWIMVDGTNVNYPVVQTDNNDYYLNHDLLGNYKGSGWPFMDYRNNSDMSDSNTIFYGHNLLNKTAFGSLSEIFTKKWFDNSNHYILVKNSTNMFVYEVFSCYYIDPEIYYLQNNFISDNEYQEFLNTLVKRSIFNYSLDVSVNDKIITLSTCTDDNKGRKVIHAKLIKVS